MIKLGAYRIHIVISQALVYQQLRNSILNNDGVCRQDFPYCLASNLVGTIYIL